MSSKNLFFSLIEADNVDKKTSVTYESLIEKVNHQAKGVPDISLDDYAACEIDYNENYTKKQLDLIANYYDISTRKKRKAELIEVIVVCAKEYSNYDIVDRRKTLWFYIEEINNDEFLNKFLILD